MNNPPCSEKCQYGYGAYVKVLYFHTVNSMEKTGEPYYLLCVIWSRRNMSENFVYFRFVWYSNPLEIRFIFRNIILRQSYKNILA